MTAEIRRDVGLGSLLIACLALTAEGGNSTTAISYQGRLRQAGAAVADFCDFEFRLFDAPAAGNRIGPTLMFDGVGGNPGPVSVVDGLFSVQLDFGAGAFDGAPRFLDVAVRCPSGAGVYTTLNPRQAVTPAPVAIHAQQANTAAGVTTPLLLSLNDPGQATLTAQNVDPAGVALDVQGDLSVGPAGEFRVDADSGNVLSQGTVSASELSTSADASIGGDASVAGRLEVGEGSTQILAVDPSVLELLAGDLVNNRGLRVISTSVEARDANFRVLQGGNALFSVDNDIDGTTSVARRFVAGATPSGSAVLVINPDPTPSQAHMNVAGNTNVDGHTTVAGHLEVDGGFIDSVDNSMGASGQYLTSTGNGTRWDHLKFFQNVDAGGFALTNIGSAGTSFDGTGDLDMAGRTIGNIGSQGSFFFPDGGLAVRPHVLVSGLPGQTGIFLADNLSVSVFRNFDVRTPDNSAIRFSVDSGQGHTTAEGFVEPKGGIRDASMSLGAAGQVLKSTGTTVQWSAMVDSDLDMQSFALTNIGTGSSSFGSTGGLTLNGDLSVGPNAGPRTLAFDAALGGLAIGPDVSSDSGETFYVDGASGDLFIGPAGGPVKFGVFGNDGSLLIGPDIDFLGLRFTVNGTSGDVVVGPFAAETFSVDGETGNTYVKGSLDLDGALLDGTVPGDGGSPGSNGQILSSTGTGVLWIDPPGQGGDAQFNTIAVDGTASFGVDSQNPTAQINGATGEATFTGAVASQGGVRDAAGSLGTANQVLSSTGTGVQWIDCNCSGGGGACTCDELNVTGNALLGDSTLDAVDVAGSLLVNKGIRAAATGLLVPAPPANEIAVYGQVASGQPSATAGYFERLGSTNTFFNTSPSATLIASSNNAGGPAAMFLKPASTDVFPAVLAQSQGEAAAAVFRQAESDFSDAAFAGATVGVLSERPTGVGLNVQTTHSSNDAPTFVADSMGDGVAGLFLYNKPTGAGSALVAVNQGLGAAGSFTLANANNAQTALFADTVGTGPTTFFLNSGTGRAGVFQIASSGNSSNVIEATTSGSGHAGRFEVTNASSTSAALTAHGNHAAEAFSAVQTGGGGAGRFEVQNAASSAPGVNVVHQGTGHGLQIVHNGPGHALNVEAALGGGGGSIGTMRCNTAGVGLRLENLSVAAQAIALDVLGHSQLGGNVDVGGNLDVDGDASIAGTMCAGSVCAAVKSFRIDHPLAPEVKYLYHASIESSEMLNVYSGNVSTDHSGYATIELPEWFEALNRDFRYQLTVIDEGDSETFVQAKVVRPVVDNRFTIRTSRPAGRVSWQVTGVRHDAYARANPLRVEVPKSERGR